MPDFGGKRDITSTTSIARVVYFHYTAQAFVKSSNEAVGRPDHRANGVSVGIIEDAIEGVEIEKSMNSAAGTFDISLLPTQNWKQTVSPGDWLVIYLHSEYKEFAFENKDIVLVGNVDRVSRTKQKDDKTDKTIVRYHISGRDFGKVFEETDLFSNPYIGQTADANLINTVLQSHGLFLSGGPSELVSKIIDVFLSPTGAVLQRLSKDGKGSTSPLGQWTVPQKLLQLFQGGESFYGILNKEIEPDLPGYTQRALLSPGQSVGLWSYLQRSSNDIVNELWTDMKRDIDGTVKPSVFLRPRPCSVFFRDKTGALNGKFKSLLDLLGRDDSFTVDSNDIYFSNLGRDEQNYSNMVWLKSTMADGEISQSQYASILTKPGQIGLPMYQKEMISRSGLKKADLELKFSYAPQGTAQNEVDTFKSFIAYLWDIRSFNRLYETGTIEAKGNIYARTGSVLKVPSENPSTESSSMASAAKSLNLQFLDPGASTSNNKGMKLYYVEGYHHSWKFPGMWTTTYSVTHGQFADAEKPFIDLPDDDYGAFDTDFDKTSLVKTNIPRSPNGPSLAGGIDFKSKIDGILS